MMQIMNLVKYKHFLWAPKMKKVRELEKKMKEKEFKEKNLIDIEKKLGR